VALLGVIGTAVAALETGWFRSGTGPTARIRPTLALACPLVLAAALERLPAGAARIERSDESVRVYAADYDVLKAVADQLPPGDHHLRPSTLEDVFLKATGRRLDARQ